MAFERSLGKVWVNACDSFKSWHSGFISGLASLEVEKEAAINSQTDKEKWSV